MEFNTMEYKNNQKLVTIIWQGKTCWIAKNIAQLAGQKDAKGSIKQFLNTHKVKFKRDYDILKEEDLKVFKKAIIGKEETIKSLIGSKCNGLLIFYKDAFIKYLDTLKTESGRNFSSWVNDSIIKNILISENIIAKSSHTQKIKIDTEIIKEKVQYLIIEEIVTEFKKQYTNQEIIPENMLSPVKEICNEFDIEIEYASILRMIKFILQRL